MRRATGLRRSGEDLLARPPSGCREVDGDWMVDPVAQLRELADLRARGLLSEAEYELHKAKVLRA